MLQHFHHLVEMSKLWVGRRERSHSRARSPDLRRKNKTSVDRLCLVISEVYNIYMIIRANGTCFRAVVLLKLGALSQIFSISLNSQNIFVSRETYK